MLQNFYRLELDSMSFVVEFLSHFHHLIVLLGEFRVWRGVQLLEGAQVLELVLVSDLIKFFAKFFFQVLR